MSEARIILYSLTSRYTIVDREHQYDLRYEPILEQYANEDAFVNSPAGINPHLG